MTVVDLAPRVQRVEGLISESEADELAARIMAAAADVARQEAVFLDLIGEFDAIGAVGWWAGIQSTAHWLSWACSMAAGTAREHVRVARALRRMPLVRKAFSLGELSYSKVREITRIADELARSEQPGESPTLPPDDGPDPAVSEPMESADPTEPSESERVGESEHAGESVPARGSAPESLTDLDESGLVELARACTASQLARTVTGWRAARGTSRDRRSRQRVAWLVQDDGSLHLTAVLPPEQGAAVVAAIQAAVDANTDPDPEPGQEAAEDRVSERDREQRVQQTRVEALTEIANHYLGSLPEDRSGEDRTMVVIEVSAAALAESDREQPEVSEEERRQAERDEVERYRSQQHESGQHESGQHEPGQHESGPEQRSRGNAGSPSSVPVTTPATVPTCRVRGGAALEPSDARRALCDSTVLGVVVDELGVPLAVGREQRLITKHQRRALMVRDGCCQFPGCTRTRHLKAHHRISWLSGGLTDLDNLILLCQSHHTRVHEDQLTINQCDEPGCGVRWRFARPDGSTIAPVVAGLNGPSPWRPGRDPAFRAANDQLVADWEEELRGRQEHAASLRTAYDHIHNTKHPDATLVFPVGGGAGFRLFDCVDALFGLTERPHRAA